MLKSSLSRRLIGITVFVLLGGVTWLVYDLGANIPSFIHLYYIPIILAGFFLGDVGGVIAGLAAAALSTWATRASGMQTGSILAFDIFVRTTLFYFGGVLTARLSANLGQRGEESATLFSASHAVSQSLRLEEILPTISKMAAEICEAKASVIRLLAPEGDELLPAASWGLSSDYLTKGPVRVADSLVDQQVRDGHVVIVRDVRIDPRWSRYREEASSEGLISCICVPLQRGGNFLGVLRVYSDYPRNWKRRDHRLLSALAAEAAVAIENAQLHESLRRSYWETVRALTRAIEAKDPSVLGHSERVTDIALQIGRQMGLSAGDMETLRFAAILHDIGKIAVEEQLLRSQNPQAYREALEQNHPLVGMSILEPAEFLRPALSGVRYHHERYDGAGYPEGLKGEKIPLLARVLAVANTYDNLLRPGGNKAAATKEEALTEIQRNSGTAFDPEVVHALLLATGRAPIRKSPPVAEESPAATGKN